MRETTGALIATRLVDGDTHFEVTFIDGASADLVMRKKG